MEEKMKLSTFIIGLIITLAILLFYTAFPFSAFFYASQVLSTTGAIIIVPLVTIAVVYRLIYLTSQKVLHLIAKRFGLTVAVVVPSVLFAVLHLVNGTLDAASMLMLFMGGTAVGIMFSLITLVKNSIWNSAVVHGLWDFFIIGIFNFTAKPDLFNLYSYHVASNNIFISGGAFGIEPSLICTIAYLLVAYIAYLEIRKNKI